MSETIHRSVTKRRTSNQSTEHELEVTIDMWSSVISIKCYGLFFSESCRNACRFSVLVQG